MTSVLSVGYGRQLFAKGDAERARLAACAETVDALHLVVFTRRAHCLTPAQEGKLFLHPTNARTRLGMLAGAFFHGRRVIKESGHRNWVISAQDPFEAGLAGYLLSLVCGLPLQVQEHGDFFGSTWWRTERPLNRLRYRFGVWLLRRAHCIRTVSARARGHIAAIGIEPARIATLSVATDTARFSAVSAPRVREQGVPVTILALGRLVREKNLPLLVRACARVAVGQRIRLVIAGSGPEERALKALASAHPVLSTTFIPWTKDVPALMRDADIFALTSYREGWARVILEAMAAGLPSVVTEVGCVGEIFHTDKHGLAVPVADEEALVAALERLAADPELRYTFGRQAAADAAAYAEVEKPYPLAWRETLRTCGV